MKYKFVEATIAYESFLYYSLDRASIAKHRDIIEMSQWKLRIVPYTHQFPDGGESICYQIQGFLPISKVFKKRRLNFEELALLLYGVIHTISNAKLSGLLPDSFVLDPQYVYLSHNSIQPYLLYIPALTDMSLKEEFLTLLDFLAGVVDTSVPNTSKLVETLKTITETDFDMNAIINTVISAANNNVVSAPKKYLEPPKKAEPKPQPQAVQPPQATPEAVQTAQAAPQASPQTAPPPQATPEPVQAAPPPKLTPQPAPPRQSTPRPTAPTPTPEEKRGFFARFFKIGVKENSENDFLPTIDDRTMIDFTAQEDGEGQPMLYLMDGNSRVEQIEIKGESFVLGRNPTQVDYCFEGDAKGVSRVHAAIIYDGSNYYATDKGSAGGTFVNDERIPPSGSAPIKNGDIIRLYNKRLLFEVL